VNSATTIFIKGEDREDKEELKWEVSLLMEDELILNLSNHLV
jgi:hypothetical protein